MTVCFSSGPIHICINSYSISSEQVLTCLIIWIVPIYIVLIISNLWWYELFRYRKVASSTSQLVAQPRIFKEIWCFGLLLATLLCTHSKLSTNISGHVLTCSLQVNNYEIVINFFYISHNLTWYSAIVHKFTRIYPVCSTYELTKQFM